MKHFSALFAILLFAARASAHDLGATARIERGRVFVETYFDDNSAPHDAHVIVTNGTGQVVAEGRTDGEGKWSFAVPPPGDYRLTIDAGGGHKTVVPLTVPGEGAGAVSHGPPRKEFARTRWLGLGIGIILIAAIVVAAKLWGRTTRRNLPSTG